MQNNQKKYLQIKEDILGKINSGELKVGDKLPSRSMLTAQYCVSDSTCKKVLYSLMQENVLEGSQGKGVFVRSSASIREVKKIAFIIWRGREVLDHPSFTQTSRGIVRAAATLEHQLIFTFIDPTTESRFQTEKKIFQTDADAFIFSYIPGLDEKMLLPIIERGAILITVGWKMKNKKTFSVTDDLNESIYKVALKFIDAGKDKIAYIGSPAEGLFEKRRQAFSHAYSECGKPFELLQIERGTEQTEDAGEAMCARILMFSVPDVIFADDDNICQGVLNALKKHSGRNKENINVVRIGNSEVKLPVPTISIPWKNLGTVAAGLIENAIRGNFPENRNIVVPCDFVL